VFRPFLGKWYVFCPPPQEKSLRTPMIGGRNVIIMQKTNLIFANQKNFEWGPSNYQNKCFVATFERKKKEYYMKA